MVPHNIYASTISDVSIRGSGRIKIVSVLHAHISFNKYSNYVKKINNKNYVLCTVVYEQF